MTLPHPALPPPRRWLSLRTLLMLLFVSAALYAGALPVYLFFRVGSAAATLAHGTQVIVTLVEDLTRRSEDTDQALRVARRAVAARALPAGATLDSVRSFVVRARAGSQIPAGPVVPDDLRAAIAHADELVSGMSGALSEATQLIAAGRWADAARRVALADSLAAGVEQQQLLVGRLAGADLLVREAVVSAATAEVRRDTILWLSLGLFLVWLGLITMRRRIWQPLGALQTGLASVSQGDLTVQIPVQRMDEAGRLASHFNEMTRVLWNRAEEQGRFAAAGELLAGVAHEVNNPLMAIAAHAENRLADPTITPEHRDEMQQVLRQAQRAGKLLRGLLRFVRATERQVGTVNLNDVVRGALDLVSYRFGVDEISVAGRLDPSLPPVRGDAIRLEQVVVNLLSNAIDAVRAIKPPRQLTVDSWIGNGTVSIAVEDNGNGVAPELAGRLFHPFVTTKGHRGTGLGLYVSRQIAREGGGDLILAAATGSRGARFVMSLPSGARPDAVPQGIRAEVAARQARLAGVRVLIVDDEAAIRRPMARFLGRRGAQVYEAVDGRDALEWLEGQTADVILVDLRMPRMGGAELFATLAATRPEVAARILFLSGDVSQLAEPGNTPVPRERVLVKPVELAELERRVAAFVAAPAA